MNKNSMKAIIIADPGKLPGPFQKRHVLSVVPEIDQPVILCTMEFLISNNITNIIIIVQDSNKQEISNIIDSEKYVGVNYRIIKKSQDSSITSVIKFLDTKDLLDDDFIIVNGFVISNFDISGAIKAHKLRKQNEAPMLLTKCFTRVPFNSDFRGEEISIVFNNADQDILKYERMSDKKACKINQFFQYNPKKHRSLTIRMDLMDCEVDIISPNILSILGDSDHYDYFKDEFINHVVESEIISDKVYFHEVKEVTHYI